MSPRSSTRCELVGANGDNGRTQEQREPLFLQFPPLLQFALRVCTDSRVQQRNVLPLLTRSAN